MSPMPPPESSTEGHRDRQPHTTGDGSVVAT